MNQTIRLSARSTPGIERTRWTAVSGKVWAKSTFAVFLEVTQRSASRCSMVIEALSRRPMKSPTWTKTSVTAKATPDTVIRKRSLSCSRFFRARSTISPLLPQQATDQSVEHQPDAVGRVSPVDPVVVALGDLERDDAVHGRPVHLGEKLGVGQLRAEPALRDPLLDRGLQERVGVLL